MIIPAKYENGVFRPIEAVDMKEGTVVDVIAPDGTESAATRGSIKNLHNIDWLISIARLKSPYTSKHAIELPDARIAKDENTTVE